MRIKKRFLFDEEKKAEEIIKEGFPNNRIDYGDIYLVAKYFRQKDKLGEITLERKLIEFCKEQDKNFNPVKNKGEIKKWVKSALNYNLRKVENVIIAQSEIDFLKKIESNRDRKLLFMVLVFVKGVKNASTRRDKRKFKKSENYYLHYSNFKDIIRMSELTNIGETKFAKILHKYKEHFLFYNPEKEIIRVEFAKHSPENGIAVKDLDNPLAAYREIFGKGMTYCEICGEEIYKRGRNQKYCRECAIVIRRKQKREEMRERRKN